MDKCETLKGPENYDKQFISSNLATACSLIPVESPEMASKLIKTTSELFEMRSDGAIAQFQLDTFAKQGKFLEDKKVAQAYVDATSKSFSKLDTPYDSCISALQKYKNIVINHPEMAPKVSDTISILQDKFPNNSYYKDCTDDILRVVPNKYRETPAISRSDGWVPPSTTNDTIDTYRETPVISRSDGWVPPSTTRSDGFSRSFVGYEATLPGAGMEEASSSRPSFLERAKALVKKSKIYAAGKKLFSNIKTAVTMAIVEHPDAVRQLGTTLALAGAMTQNPLLTAAGVIAIRVTDDVQETVARKPELQNLIQNIQNLRGTSTRFDTKGDTHTADRKMDPISISKIHNLKMSRA